LQEGVISGNVRKKEQKDAVKELASAEEAKAAALKLEKALCTGGLAVEEIRRVVDKALETLNRCGLSGVATFKLTIDSNGRVVGTSQVKGPGKTDAAVRCMIQNLKTLRFPKPRHGAATEVVLVFSV
jgi:hypothetical protein